MRSKIRLRENITIVLKRMLSWFSSNKKTVSLLKFFQAFLYLAVVFLWFKDHLPVLEKIKISYLVPLVLLLILTLLRTILWFYRKKPKPAFRWNRDLTIIIALILLAISIRTPFFMNYYGILNSDDAMPLLQAKHMAEGELSAIYYYGQTRIGSLPFHIYALLFKLFGYSVLIGIIAYFLPFLGFIIIQYFFFKAIFSCRTLAFILALFFCLPFRHLLSLSFYIGSNMTFAFFLGSLAMYLSFLVYRENKLSYIPVSGFCLGLALWTYPFSIIFALCAAFFILLRVRFHVKHYFSLFLYFLIGLFPAILFEFISPQKTLTFLFSGTRISGFPWEKMQEIMKKVTVLISGEQNILSFVYLIIILSGIAGAIFLSLKKRKFLPETIFVIYFLGFFLIYSFSRFPIDDSKLRYFYAFYFALPFLLIGALNLINKKVKYILMLSLFLIIVVFSNIRDVYDSYIFTKGAHKHLNNIIQVMLQTGEKYWLGSFWDVHLLTALSGEKIIGWRYTHHGEHRHIPFKYMLSYFNRGENNNYVFFKQPGSFSIPFKEILPTVDDNLDYAYKQSEHLLKILEKLKIRTKQKRIDDCRLIYESESSLLPAIMKVDIPEKIPELSLVETEIKEGWMILRFIQGDSSSTKGFRIIVEIEDFCSIDNSISTKNDEIMVRVPLPDHPAFKLKYFLEYQGAKLPTTKMVQKISLPQYAEIPFSQRRDSHIVYLTGSIPGRQPGERYLEKEAAIEINKNLKAGSKIHLQLISSLIYPKFFRYGDYSQEVKILFNDRILEERKLEDGENLIEVTVPDTSSKLERAVMNLNFKYHLPLPHYPRKKTSAILKNIAIRY